jgi:chemotaxis protein MotB
MLAEAPSTPRQDWIVTFADMMSLLLAFFILLVSLNGLKQDRREDQFQSMMSSLRNRFGDTSTKTAAAGGGGQAHARRADELSAGRAQRRATLQQAAHVRAWNENSAVAVRDSGSLEQVAAGTQLSFASSSRILEESHEQELQAIVSRWQRQPQAVLVRGYSTGRTLAEPSPFRDEWDLAYERCHVVVERLTAGGVDPRQIRVAVAAPSEVISGRPGPLRGAQHDQIDVVLLNEFRDEIVNPTQAQDAPTSTPASE